MVWAGLRLRGLVYSSEPLPRLRFGLLKGLFVKSKFGCHKYLQREEATIAASWLISLGFRIWDIGDRAFVYILHPNS